MAPFNHMFDDHPLCSSSWCHKKRKEIMVPLKETIKVTIAVK